MSRLDIDFAATARRRPSPAGLALLLLGAATLSLVSLELGDLDQQTAAAEARLKGLLRRGAPTAKPAGAAGTTRNVAGDAAGEVLARLGAPWPELLQQLEALADLPVAILDLDADARGRTLRLVGEAKTLEDMLAFVESLRQSRSLDEVHLQAHEMRKVGAAEVFAFTVQATWPRARVAAP